MAKYSAFLFFFLGFSLSLATVPVLNVSPAGPVVLSVGQLNFTATASDLDSDPLVFSWSFQSYPSALTTPPAISLNNNADSSVATINFTVQGDYILQVIVDDQDGNPASQSSRQIPFTILQQQIFYVSNLGNDTTPIDQISQTQPLKTIPKALEYTGAGDTIILLPDSLTMLAPTTFFSTLADFGISGSSQNPVTIRGYSAGLITIRPSGSANAMRFFSRSYVTIKDLSFQNFTDAAILINQGSNIRIENCKFIDNGIGISTTSSTKTTISNSFFKQNQSGIVFNSSSQNTVLLNTFSKNTQFGVRLIQGTTPSLNNRIVNNTFYDNGSLYRIHATDTTQTTKHAAVSLGNNSANTVMDNLFVANIKDFDNDNLGQTSINRNLSFLNVGIEKDPLTMANDESRIWYFADPLLIDPEGDDFRLGIGSIALGSGEGGINLGAFQSTGVIRPSTKTIYVDYDLASVTYNQNGLAGSPYQSINTALQNANPGDKILVKASLNQAYTLDFSKLKKTAPGWGWVRVIGNPKENNGNTIYPTISCFNNNESGVLIQSKRFLSLENFLVSGYKNNTPSQCLNGIKIQNSRHINLDRIISFSHSDSGIDIDSSQAIRVSSSVLYENTLGLRLQNTGINNQYNLYDKLTITDNLSAISVAYTYKTTIQNTIIYSPGNDCLEYSGPTQPLDMKIRYSLCAQTGAIDAHFTAAGSFNLSGNPTSLNPLFFSVNSTVRRTSPHFAFLLSASATAISPALNVADPGYQPAFLIEREFSEPLSLDLPANLTRSQPGRMDMGAFEQAKTDVDKDNINNLLDSTKGLSPINSKDATLDFDNDGLTNIQEITHSQYPTNITSSDTDHDGYTDGVEIAIGANPTVDDALYIQGKIPHPVILAHATTIPPGRYTLEGTERDGKNVMNRWILVSSPTGTTQASLFINATEQNLTFEAITPGKYEIGLDQTLISTLNNGVSLNSDPKDRAMTTITIQDLPPVPVLPPDVTITYTPGKIIYFYGDPTLTQNPSFDPNGNDILTTEWILKGPLNPPAGLIDFSSKNPYMVLPERTAVYSFQLKVSSSGPAGIQSSVSEKEFKISVTSPSKSLPIANAGNDTMGSVNQILTLNGLGSGDYQNSPLSWYWRQKSGPQIQFTKPKNCPLQIFQPSAHSLLSTTCATEAQPQFIATQIGVVELELIVSKTVETEKIYSSSDVVFFTIDSEQNSVPIARISYPQNPKIKTTVILDGASSSDSYNASNLGSSGLLYYSWKQVSGNPVYLNNTNLSTLAFTPIREGIYGFSLTVKDIHGADSRPVIAEVAVETDQIALPVANAGNNQNSLTNRTIILDGNSSIGGSEVIRSWFWNQTEGPELVELTSQNSAALSFIPKKAGIYTFSLHVATAKYISKASSVSVIVNSNEQFVPVAMAGENQYVNLETPVTLNGSNSFDYDNDPLTFYWQQVYGPAAILSAMNQKIVTFTPKTAGIYQFSLTVSDGKSNSVPSYITISASENAPTTTVKNPPFDPTTILGKDPKGGCMIVSASFGENSISVSYFKWIRDHLLLKSKIGIAIMRAYYLYSPPIAEKISNSLILKIFSQALLLMVMLVSFSLPAILLLALFFLKKTKL